MDPTSALADLSIDHIEFYVADLRKSSSRLRDEYGLRTYAVSHDGPDAVSTSVLLGTEDIRLVLTQPLADSSPGLPYVTVHGDGVADVALRTPDAAAAHAAAVAGGARTVAPPESRDGVITATIEAFGDVTHTFVQRPGGCPDVRLPGLVPVEVNDGEPLGLRSVDHIAVCLEPLQLAPTVRFYCEALGFSLIFRERITIGDQAVDSEVVQSTSGGVTLTFIAQDRDLAPGQIDEFLKNHGGPGVQHVALRVDDIVRTVTALGERGVEFLSTPDAYYDALYDRLSPRGHSAADLRALGLLVDEDHDGQLFQIFTKPTHPRQTYFTEVIERVGARSFGSGNIRALYDSVRREGGS